MNTPQPEIDQNTKHEMLQQVQITKTDYKNSRQDTKKTGVTNVLFPKNSKLQLGGKKCDNIKAFDEIDNEKMRGGIRPCPIR